MLKTQDTVLVCIDVQEKLARAMPDKERLFSCLGKLMDGVSVLGVPAILTEQNPRGLGPTVSHVAEKHRGAHPVSKMSFSCWDTAAFKEALQSCNRRQVILAGIEAHICVYQTAVDLVSAGYGVEIVVDCVASRTTENKQIALEKMQAAGAGLTTTEMILFELIKTAESPRFREIASIIK